MPSPNPGGRPRGIASATREIHRQVDMPRLVSELLKLSYGGAMVPPKVQLDAARTVIDRVDGKALTRTISVAISGRSLPADWDALPDDERAAFVAGLERGTLPEDM